MAPVKKTIHQKREGAILIIAMIFVVIFSALAISMATISGTNGQIATNQQKVDCALGSAESGLDVERYWLHNWFELRASPCSPFLLKISNHYS